jgi:hypothetical protein
MVYAHRVCSLVCMLITVNNLAVLIDVFARRCSAICDISTGSILWGVFAHDANSSMEYGVCIW